MRFILPLLVSTAIASPALALDQCKPTQSDQNVRVCDYSPEQRYVVTGVIGFPINLQFGSDEHVKRYEFAYTGKDKAGLPARTWRGPPSKEGQPIAENRYKNNLPIWAFDAGHSALIVVSARPDGSERAYSFDLIAREQAADCNASPQGPGCPADVATTSTLMFNYPADAAQARKQEDETKKRAIAEAWRVRQAALKEQQASARLKTDVFYGTQNYAYQAKADPKFKQLAPSKVSDNGWLTQMQWPGNVQIPAITILDPASGQERVPAITHENGMEVINGTAEWFRLRLGPAVMDIHNLNWSPNRPDPRTGTTSPDVVRQVIYKASQP